MQQDFSAIYDQYVTRIYRFIVLKVSSVEVAEDLCSEVFLRVLREFEKNEIQNMQAFLYQVARYTVADYYRGRESVQVVSIEETQEIISEDSLFDEAALSMDIAELKKALATLKDDYQNFIIWRYLDELSMEEIAKITGKKEGNVRVGVHRALEALKAKMEEPMNVPPRESVTKLPNFTT